MLITIFVVLLILALALYGIERFMPGDETIKRLIGLVMVVVAIIYIAHAAGIA